MLPVTYDSSNKIRKSSANVIALPAPEKNVDDTCQAIARFNKTIHDVRSSLNVIIGYSELMLDGVLGKVTEEQSEGIRDILASSQHLLELVNELRCRPATTRT